MLFYRRKLLLAILEAFNGSVDRLKFQKYLFLISELQEKKSYNFIPYKYGCFSFESYNDKRGLTVSGYLEDSDQWILKKNDGFLSQIDAQDKKYIFTVKKEYGRLSKKALLNKIYSNYPYYAINSEIVDQTDLTPEEILHKKPKQKERCLFTIGYEGRSIDEYLNILIENNIKVLCDVRKNPFSRKYGFSKQFLQNKITDLGIQYLHIPELGIDSKWRKNLNTKQDYKKLFSIYEKDTLALKENQLQGILKNLNKKKRIALTCFEAESSLCHRHCVSTKLNQLDNSVKVKHL